MKKYLILILVIIGLVAVAYFTFVMAVIEFVVGLVFLGIMLLALLGLWIAWKKRKS